MKKLTVLAITAACLAAVFVPSRASADTITNSIVCNPADYTCQSVANVNNSIASGTDAIGFAGGTPNWNAVLMFPLPTLPAGKIVGNLTTLKITLSSVGASTTFNGDIWGIANFRTDLPTGTPNSTFYYYLATDAGPGANPTGTDAKLVNNFLTPSLIGSAGGTAVTTVAGGSNALQNYIQGFYDANPTYDATAGQAYVWLRINPDGNSSSTANRYVINAGDTGVSTALRPTLNLFFTDPPAAPPLVWNGNLSAVWDLNTTANWKSNSVSGIVYQDGFDVLLDDTLAGNAAINLTAAVAPKSVTFDNLTTNYSISGTGKITGTTGLIKLGVATAILDTDNDYSGGTTLAGGTLQVGNGDTHGSLGSGPVAVTTSGLSSLAFNRTDAITVNTIVNGGGNPLVVVNSGQVTLAGATDNSGTAAIVNSGATLILGKASSGSIHSLGTSSTINPGGTLALGGTGGDQIYQNVVITNNGTFDLAGLNEGFNGLTGLGIVTNSVATNAQLALGDGNGSVTFNGLIVDGAAAVGVTKNGTGIETLAGANSYSGPTTVRVGELVISTSAIGHGSYNVADAATLGVSVVSSNGVLDTAAFNAGNATVDFQNVSSATTAPLNVSLLNLTNSLTLRVSSGNLIPGQSYPLITYGTLGGSSSFLQGSLPSGVFGNLNTIGNTVYLQVTSTALTWNGNVAGGVWDINDALNWKAGGVTGLAYPDGEVVTFDDSLTGTAIVNLTETVSPASITFSNNVTPYTLTGVGYVTGPVTFVKNGTNTLIVDTDNDYYGGTLLGGGTLQIGNNDTHGTLGFGAFTNLGSGSILAFNRTDSITIGNITRTTVDNSASIVVNSGVVILGGTGDNSGAGATVNAGGTLVLAKDSTAVIHAVSGPNIVINPGGLIQLSGTGGDQIYFNSGMTDNGTLDMAGLSEGFDRLSGVGVVSNSAGGAPILQLGENNGSATFAGTIVNGAGTLGLTKIGTGIVTLAGASTYTGATTVTVGKLVATTASTGAGGYSTANAATLGVNVATSNGSLNAGSLTLGSSAASALEFQNLNSATVAALNAGSLTVNGPVTVNIVGGAFAAGQSYPLIAYGSLTGSGSFVIGALPSGIMATLNTAASPISLMVTSVVNRTPPTLDSTFSNGTLTLQWPLDHIGFVLQSNAVSLLSTNSWQAVPGSTMTNSVSIVISTNNPQVYYRLRD